MDSTKDDQPEHEASGLPPSDGTLERQIARGEVPEQPLISPQLPEDLAAHLRSRDDGTDFGTSAGSDFGPEGTGPSEAPVSEKVDSLAFVPDRDRPSFRFFGVVAALSLIADITTKVWAEVVINERGFEPIKIVGENISITLAYNQGGAWGLFAGADEMVRKPFFLCVSAFAIFFIISLYSRLHPNQRALKWGLPLVLGGALGNLSDRITRSQVIDFIDYRGDWVMSLNAFVHQYFKSWAVTDHWPTFNVADIAICIGVGLMAVDMFTHRPRQLRTSAPPPPGTGVDPMGPVVS